jgi:hypothetical protein
MQRTVQIRLKDVTPVPSSLRFNPAIDHPVQEIPIDLAKLFLQYYFDSFPAAPPKPDPTRFEYLELVSGSDDFRFHSFVREATKEKKRTISFELGQAFCRLLLHDHFKICYFAHLQNVVNKSTHAAFGGMKIVRKKKGDIPDYLCARKVTEPRIAEAKGSFRSIAFDSTKFSEWRQQFETVEVLNPMGSAISLKGYIGATRFATAKDTNRTQTTTFIEDPETVGEPLRENDDWSRALGRVTLAQHYARIFSKLGLSLLASALDNGFALTRQLTFTVPVWTCMVPPFAGKEFVGGFYRTQAGPTVTLTEKGWVQPSFELPLGHFAFVGLDLNIARDVAEASRGEWSRLDGIGPELVEPRDFVSSEFAWLLDGSVVAPATYFLPTGAVTL